VKLVAPIDDTPAARAGVDAWGWGFSGVMVRGSGASMALACSEETIPRALVNEKWVSAFEL
jgi:hypothetical protein